MRVGARFVMLAAIAALVVMAGVVPVLAQSPNFPNFGGSLTSLTLNGNAAQNGNVLRLTPNQLDQAGSAWFNIQQPVAGSFSTTFTFQISGANNTQPGCAPDKFGFCPADGFAFLIQNSPTGANSGLAALGPDGCGIGFGDSSTGCTPPTGGITNSVAVEFDTFQNGDDPSNNHVAIQSCQTSSNTRDPGICRIADNPSLQTTGAVTTTGTTTVTWASGNQFNTAWVPGTTIVINGSPFVIASVGSATSLTVTVAPPAFSTPTPYSVAINMADGNPHQVTITFAPPVVGVSTGTLDVILDNTDLFPPTNSNPTGGVPFDMTSISLNSGSNAWVGFTAATGGADDNQDILSWTFTPQTQTALVTVNQQSTLNFQNTAQQNVYDYTSQLTSGAPTTVQIKPILMTQPACNVIVQKSFWPAHCFVYNNAENSGMDAAVMFEVTCPQSPGGTCGSSSNQDFFAELGTDFQFQRSDNPLFTYPGIFGLLNPFPGWLKGDGGPDPLHPCTPPTTGALFQSNQVDTFFIDGGTTRGKGNGGASCWVATYDTPGELPPGIKITSPTYTTYSKGQSVTASYSCNNPTTSKPATNPTGPYLTAASCTQSTGVQGACTPTLNGLSCTGTVDTSSKGPHLFTVTAIDSGGNANVNLVIYNVK